MLSFQRLYGISTILLFVIISFFYFPHRKSAHLVYPIQLSAQDSLKFASFFKRSKVGFRDEKMMVLKFNLNGLDASQKTVMEIDDSGIHKATLMLKSKEGLKNIKWLNCDPGDNLSLNSRPYFIFDSKNISSEAYLIMVEPSYASLPFKIYKLADFYKKKDNQLMITVIVVFILLGISLVLLYACLKLRNGYSLFMFSYIVLCLFSSTIYNGISNNFWPFSIDYVSDHAMSICISIHLTVVCLFVLIYMYNTQIKKIFQYLNAVFLMVSLSFLTISFVTDSYELVKYQVYFSLLISFILLICYKNIYKEYRSKDAYWCNLFAITSYVALALIFSLKYLNAFTPNFLLEILQKLLFLAHIIFLFLAFLSINKKKLLADDDVKLDRRGDQDFSSHITANPNGLLSDVSEREFEVLALIAEGLRDQEIADNLFVSLATVKTHKQRIYRKLNINNKSQATQLYFQFTSKTIDFVNDF